MNYRIIKENIREIVSEEELEKFEKAQDKLERDNYAKTMPSNELFDMCIYFKILAEAGRKVLFELHLKQAEGEDIKGSQIAAQRQNIARYMTASRFWGGNLQKRLDEEGKKFNVGIKVKELMALIISEDKYEGTKSLKTKEIKENKQKLLDEINEVVGGREPGEE